MSAALSFGCLFCMIIGRSFTMKIFFFVCSVLALGPISPNCSHLRLITPIVWPFPYSLSIHLFHHPAVSLCFPVSSLFLFRFPVVSLCLPRPFGSFTRFVFKFVLTLMYTQCLLFNKLLFDQFCGLHLQLLGSHQASL